MLTSPSFLEISIEAKYSPLTSLHDLHPYPNIYLAQLELSIPKIDSSPNPFITLTELGIMIYNCPANCKYCTNAEPPLGSCSVCDNVYLS